MAQTEFRKLKRLELVDIIYKLQEGLEDQKKETEELKKKLADRELKMEKAGSIAQAAVALNELMETAQRTADQYLISVRGAVRREELEASQRTAEAAFTAERLIREAKSGAEELRKKAETEAKAVREKAEAEAKELRKTMETEEEKLRERMEAERNVMLEKAETEAKEILEKAENEAKELREKAEADAAQIRRNAHDEAECRATFYKWLRLKENFR